MVNGAMAICSLRYVMNLYTMASQDDPRRHAKEVCASASRIQVHKHIKKVASASNIRVHGGNILTQPVPLQRRTSMPIMPKRSGVPCAENVQPFDGRPIGMPKQPRDCRGCYGCTGWCTISFVSILLGFYHLSSFRYSDLGCWVYYENTLPSPPRSEHRPSIPCGGSRA